MQMLIYSHTVGAKCKFAVILIFQDYVSVHMRVCAWCVGEMGYRIKSDDCVSNHGCLA